jgi:hypothetical protein
VTTPAVPVDQQILAALLCIEQRLADVGGGLTPCA